MIKVRIRKPLIEEELLVEDIQNLGLPSIVVTRILEEFGGQEFNTKKAEDIVGRMYKERATYGLNPVGTLYDNIEDEITSIAQLNNKELSNEFVNNFNKIKKFNIMDKMPLPSLSYKEMKGLEKSFKKAVKGSFVGELEKEMLQVIETKFAEYHLKKYDLLFVSYGQAILNYLKKHPTNWRELAKLNYDEALSHIEEINSTQEKEKDIVHKYKDGFYWIDLGEGACELEAKRMGHCGSDNRGNLVSLRSKVKGSKASKSHITLAYNKHEDVLYQIKGQGNSAPDKKYFKYIGDFIDRFDITEVKEDGEHSNDDFDELLEYIENHTNAEVDLNKKQLLEAIESVNNGDYDTNYLSFHADDREDWGEELSVFLSTNLKFSTSISFPVDNIVDADELSDSLEYVEVAERISEIGVLENYIEDLDNLALNCDYNHDGDRYYYTLTVDIDIYDNDNSHLPTKHDLYQAVDNWVYEFGDSDIEGIRDEIKDIMVDFAGELIESPGKDKIIKVLEKIEEIEEGYKYFFAEYDINNPRESIDFILRSSLPVEIPTFAYQIPRDWNNKYLGGGFVSASNWYSRKHSEYLSTYVQIMKNLFRQDIIEGLLNDSIKNVVGIAYENAMKQTKLDFPGYKLDKEDAAQYIHMGGSFFSNVEVKYPSAIDLQQDKTLLLPKIGIRGNAEIKWTDSVEDIVFLMRWVNLIDSMWPQIVEDMKPHIEQININLQKKNKELKDKFRKEMEEIAKQNELPLQENKRKIRILIKK